MEDERRIGGSALRLIIGDVTDLDVECFVYYARSDLLLGSGFGTAISVRGGPAVQEELKKLAPVAVTEAVISSAGNMKARQIIHAVGPRFQEEDLEERLRLTMINVLRLADRKEIRQLGFPAMGAGFYGVPLALCARVMITTIENYLQGESGLEEIILCARDAREYAVFKSELAATIKA